MPEGQVLEFSGVTKQFGSVTAVSGFSARVEPGSVTGFLGPNGAGKTTTLRILLGLVRATAGTATIGGEPYSRLRRPLQSVGAVLEASSFHPGRTAANHLTVYARAAGLEVPRVDEVLGMVGLSEVAGSKVGGFSLGMKQRLGLAFALLGDPGVLILDEPANGLDPEGIVWMRSLLRELARQGRTVLVSSHLLTEVQQTVDALVVIAQGRLVFQGGLDELTDPDEFVTVVDSPDRTRLAAALSDAGADVELLRSGLTVRGSTPAEVGAVASSAGVGLSLLQRRGPGLEEVFLDLVRGTRVHASAGGVSDRGFDTAAAPPPQPADGAAAPPPEPAGDEDADAEPAGRVVAEGDVSRPGEPDTDGDSDTAAAPPTQQAGGATAPPRQPARAGAAYSVASTGVIDIVTADEAADDDAPEFFESGELITDPAPGAADAPGENVIEPASEAPEHPSADDADREIDEPPPTPRWEAQFDPIVAVDAERATDEEERR